MDVGMGLLFFEVLKASLMIAFLLWHSLMGSFGTATCGRSSEKQNSIKGRMPQDQGLVNWVKCTDNQLCTDKFCTYSESERGLVIRTVPIKRSQCTSYKKKNTSIIHFIRKSWNYICRKLLFKSYLVQSSFKNNVVKLHF